MLQLSNIEFRVKQNLLQSQSKKLIRFSINSIIIRSKNFGTLSDANTIKWDQKLRIPQVSNKNAIFQIFNAHEFGYNPEELGTVLTGKINISSTGDMINSNVYNAMEPHKIIGTLTIRIQKQEQLKKQQRYQNKSVNKSQAMAQSAFSKSQQYQTYKLVTSILVRNVINPPQKGYITVYNEETNKTHKSQMIQQLKGEFMFFMKSKFGNPIIKSKRPDNKILIQFHSQDDKLTYRAQLSMQNDKKVNRIQLFNIQKKVVGEVYIQIETKQKNGKINSIKPMASLSSKYETKESLKKSNLIPKFRSMSVLDLTKMGQSQFLGTSRKKIMSIYNNNNDIVFPSEKRFQLYQDKQTNVISYSNLPSMKFQEQHSHKYYKGASMGKGNKQDFTLFYKKNPGVGQYNLPSIFDRY